MDRDTILRRAAKLAALAEENPSMAEAESASHALARLLAEHRLTMADVSQAAIKAGIVCECRDSEWRRMPAWVEILTSAIGKACGCVPMKGELYDREFLRSFNTVSFVGDPADAAVAAYWWTVMVRLLPRIANKNRDTIEAEHLADVRAARRAGYRAELRTYRRLRPSFLAGAATRIGERLADKLRPPVGEAGASGSDLVIRKDRAIEEWIQENLDVGQSRKRAFDGDHSAMQAGRAAADGVELADGVHHAAGHRRELISPGGEA